MNQAKRNLRIILIIQFIITQIIVITLSFMERGSEKTMVRGVVFGLMLAMIIESLIYFIKPDLYRPKQVRETI